MYSENSFVTLTYDDQHLKSEKLIYSDFQKFMKRLRRTFPNKQIGCFVTGEYGDKQKRPHWHAILFNFQPTDLTYKYSNDRGDRVFNSESLTRIWGHGIAECGSVTFESAGYCARYAAKKLSHGRDGDHEFNPISKKSSKHAIGKKFIEQFWPEIFSLGSVVLPEGRGKCSIPRYYERWLKKNEPKVWNLYVTQTKQRKIDEAIIRSEKEKNDEKKENQNREPGSDPQITRDRAREVILEQTYQKLLASKTKL